MSRWRDRVDWWTDPRLAYQAGLEDGYVQGRDQQLVEDDHAHRTAVRRAVTTVDQADRRAAADAGELAA